MNTKKIPLLKSDFFSQDDPKNPKNINAEEKLKEMKRKREEELANKKIVIKEKNKERT